MNKVTAVLLLALTSPLVAVQNPIGELAKSLTPGKVLSGSAGPGFSGLGLGGGLEITTEKGYLDAHLAAGSYSLLSYRLVVEGGYSFGQKLGYGNAYLGLGLLFAMIDLGAFVPFNGNEKARFLYGPSIDIPLGSGQAADSLLRLYFHWEHRADQNNFKKLGLAFAFAL